MKRILLLAACVPFAAHAQIFKCVDGEGRITFQDSACKGSVGSKLTVVPAGGAYTPPPQFQSPAAAPLRPVPVPVRPAGQPPVGLPPGITAPPIPRVLTQAERDAAQLKLLETERKRRTMDYEIRDAETAVESLQASMEQALSVVRARKEGAGNVSPGSVLEQSALAEMQSVSDRYGLQIRTAQERLTDLRKQREDLSRPQK